MPESKEMTQELRWTLSIEMHAQATGSRHTQPAYEKSKHTHVQSEWHSERDLLTTLCDLALAVVDVMSVSIWTLTVLLHIVLNTATQALPHIIALQRTSLRRWLQIGACNAIARLIQCDHVIQQLCDFLVQQLLLHYNTHLCIKACVLMCTYDPQNCIGANAQTGIYVIMLTCTVEIALDEAIEIIWNKLTNIMAEQHSKFPCIRHYFQHPKPAHGRYWSRMRYKHKKLHPPPNWLTSMTYSIIRLAYTIYEHLKNISRAVQSHLDYWTSCTPCTNDAYMQQADTHRLYNTFFARASIWLLHLKLMCSIHNNLVS